MNTATDALAFRDSGTFRVSPVGELSAAGCGCKGGGSCGCSGSSGAATGGQISFEGDQPADAVWDVPIAASVGAGQRRSAGARGGEFHGDEPGLARGGGGFTEGGAAARGVAPGWVVSGGRGAAVATLGREVASGSGSLAPGVDGELFDAAWVGGGRGECSGVRAYGDKRGRGGDCDCGEAEESGGEEGGEGLAFGLPYDDARMLDGMHSGVYRENVQSIPEVDRGFPFPVYATHDWNPYASQNECPEICLVAADQVRTCLQVLRSTSDIIQYNKWVGYCGYLITWYNAICAGIPGCPSFGLPTTKPVCGPDVTEWVANNLKKCVSEDVQSRLRAPYVGGPGERSFQAGMNWANSSMSVKRCIDRMNIKSQMQPDGSMKSMVATANCPVKCPESISFCGFCMSDQVPGNMSLGLAVGMEWLADTASAVDQLVRWGMSLGDALVRGGPIAAFTDTEEDAASIEIGVELADLASLPSPEFQEQMCSLVKKAVDGQRIEKYPCPLCSEKQSNPERGRVL